MRPSIYDLVHNVILPWLPEYHVVQDRDLTGIWHIRTSAKGRHCGTIVYNYTRGLIIKLDDPDLTAEMRTRVLISNLEGEIFVEYMDRRLPNAFN